MRCRDVEKLVSLHVRGDLDGARERDARAHIEACADCRTLAGEYLNVLQLMRLYEPPEFSDGTFDAIRSNVLSEINRNNLLTKSKFSSPALLLFARRFFHRRTVVAASLMLLISACALLAAFIQFRNANVGLENDRAADFERSGRAESARVAIQPSKASVENLAPVILDRKFASAPRGSKKIAHEFLRASTRASRTNVFRLAKRDAENVSASLQATDQALAAQSTQGLENIAQSESAVARVSITSRETLRLEIHTSDPDIRIIWFAPKADMK